LQLTREIARSRRLRQHGPRKHGDDRLLRQSGPHEDPSSAARSLADGRVIRLVGRATPRPHPDDAPNSHGSKRPHLGGRPCRLCPVSRHRADPPPDLGRRLRHPADRWPGLAKTLEGLARKRRYRGSSRASSHPLHRQSIDVSRRRGHRRWSAQRCLLKLPCLAAQRPPLGNYTKADAFGPGRTYRARLIRDVDSLFDSSLRHPSHLMGALRRLWVWGGDRSQMMRVFAEGTNLVDAG
jgi:hypothetical protein